jgi:mannonate dehydratase
MACEGEIELRHVLRPTWRWFGPDDKVSVRDAAQAGAHGLVCSLYHIPPGDIWSMEAIEQRQNEVAASMGSLPLEVKWEVVESLPVSESIKTQTGPWREHIANWKTSMEHLARSGLTNICYNFMPILDWTRTDHRHVLPHGGTAMSFDLVSFAVFDIHILNRDGAAECFPDEVVREAAGRFQAMDTKARDSLSDAIVAGLAGAVESWTVSTLNKQLERYADIDNDRLRQNLFDFLEQVVPDAERLGVNICCHPDDPPFTLLGLPKVASTEEDYRLMIEAVDSPSNGITFCSGSLGSRSDNDLVGFVERLGHRISYVHLRNVTRSREGVPTGFLEDDHLGGQVDMVGVIGALLQEQEKRLSSGRADWHIPMRPDHGHELLNDFERGTRAGYPAVGRLKGMAELKGVMHALARIGA